MKVSGFTLVEFLIASLVLAILATLAVPSFKQIMQNSRTKTAQYALIGAIEHARALSVFSGSRSILKSKDKWHQGWQIFLDKNDNGVADADEPILLDHPALTGVTINGNNKVRSVISFISTGEARVPGKANAGAFVAGTLTICPQVKGKGYKLVLSRGGRTRTEQAGERDCN